jgi:hypothetical protein
MTDIPKITVIVRGGLVQDAEIEGKAHVIVHDYDVDMDDRPHGRNEDGELYVIAGRVLRRHMSVIRSAN